MRTEASYGDVLHQALAQPGYRRLGLLAGSVYLLLYLYALGQLVIDPRVTSSVGYPAVAVVPGWPGRVFEPISGYSFQPVVSVYLLPGLALFLAPLNVLTGAFLGGLIGLNVATAAYALASVRSCRRLSWTGLLGSVPGLLTGFACCVPTVALVLGANFALAIIGLQTYLLPASFAALVAGLVWNLHRTRRELLQAA